MLNPNAIDLKGELSHCEAELRDLKKYAVKLEADAKAFQWALWEAQNILRHDLFKIQVRTALSIIDEALADAEPLEPED